MSELTAQLTAACHNIEERIKDQMQSRAVRASYKLKNAELDVIQGQGGGRMYRVPGTKRMYQASAPGEVPAVRTGAFRNSWQPSSIMFGDVAVSKLETTLTVNGYNLGGLLEDGTSKMAARPHQKKILEKAKPEVLAIYNEPYL